MWNVDHRQLDRSIEVASATSNSAASAAIAVPSPSPAAQVASANEALQTMSLPTPRTLRLLGSELFMRKHFPDLLRTRTFKVGDRVQANWNAFGYWYGGVVMAAADSKYPPTMQCLACPRRRCPHYRDARK